MKKISLAYLLASFAISVSSTPTQTHNPYPGARTLPATWTELEQHQFDTARVHTQKTKRSYPAAVTTPPSWVAEEKTAEQLDQHDAHTPESLINME